MNSLNKFSIGGMEQWVLFRGNNNKNPVLLFLQQGPGFPMISEADTLEKALKLENDFTVAYWDQRGCGKSYYKTIPAASMNIGQMIADTHELTGKIKIKFKVSKIYLAGFSIGGTIALLSANEYPKDYYACISVGPEGKTDEGDEIAYKFILDQASGSGNKRALKEIKKIGQPPHIESGKFLKRVKWVANFGGVNRKENFNSMLIKTLKNMFLSKEYSLLDILKALKGMKFAQKNLLKELSLLNMFDKIKNLKIPLYIFQGKYDFASPSILVEKFLIH